MNVKSWMVVCASVATLAMAGEAQAGFPGLGGGKGASAGELDAFLNDAQAADALMANAAWWMVRTVAADQDLKRLQDERDAANGIKDPHERDVALALHRKHVDTVVSTVNMDDAARMIAGADQKKKEQLSSSIWNYSLALLKDTELVGRGAKLVAGVPDPSVATRVTRLKGFVENMKSQIDSGKHMTSGIKKLQAATGMKALPSSASDKAVATNDT